MPIKIRSNQNLKLKKRIQLILFFASCFAILWLTLLSRTPRLDHKLILRLFWSYRNLFSGRPNGWNEVVQNLENILLFMPFGFFFPWKRKHWSFTMLCGACFSLVIELTQYFFKLGWCELDDLVCNTLGTFLGFLLWRGLIKLFKERN